MRTSATCGFWSAPIALALLAGAPASAAVSFADLGLLPGFDQTHCSAISGDGSTATGFCQTSSGGYRAYRWTSAGGMQDIGIVSGFPRSLGFAVNPNGSIIAGTAESANGSSVNGFRWTQAGGMQSIGSDRVPYGMSADGSVFAGKSFNRAVRWTNAGGVQNLGMLPGDTESYAFGISGDGAVVVGQSQGTLPKAFRWTAAGGMQNLGHLPGASGGVAQAVSFDGSVVVGLAYAADNNAHAFRWTAGGGMQDLGIINADGLPTSEALAISGDGNAVVGMSESRAFLWRSSLGMVDLNAYLPTLGIDLSGWTLERATGASADGMTICGEGYYLGQYRSWVAAIPVPSAAVPLMAVGCLFTARRRRCVRENLL